MRTVSKFWIRTLTLLFLAVGLSVVPISAKAYEVNEARLSDSSWGNLMGFSDELESSLASRPPSSLTFKNLAQGKIEKSRNSALPTQSRAGSSLTKLAH